MYTSTYEQLAAAAAWTRPHGTDSNQLQTAPINTSADTPRRASLEKRRDQKPSSIAQSHHPTSPEPPHRHRTKRHAADGSRWFVGGLTDSTARRRHDVYNLTSKHLARLTMSSSHRHSLARSGTSSGLMVNATGKVPEHPHVRCSAESALVYIQTRFYSPGLRNLGHHMQGIYSI